MKKLFHVLFILMMTVSLNVHAQSDNGDSEKPQKSFVERMPKPIRWIIKNWSAKDSTYCIDAFYNWSVQLQDNLSREYLNYTSPEGHEMHVASRLANKIGPYFGYRWITFGTTWDFFSQHAERRNEFTLSINSQLFNIDLIRRRTGGDFGVQKFLVFMGNEGKVDLADYLENRDIGEYITYDITGADISLFTNHKKFSNPAGYSNGAIQLRTAGSPIIGLGYTNQHMKFDFYEPDDAKAVQTMAKDFFEKNKEYFPGVVDKITNNATALMEMFKAGTGNDQGIPKEINNQAALYSTYSLTRIPHKVNINDFHLQLGYALNVVLSRRLLVSASAVAMPALKIMSTTTPGTIAYDAIALDANPQEGYNSMNKMIVDYYKSQGASAYIDPTNPVEVNFGPQEFKQTRFGFDTKLRAAITYNYDRWRVGAKGQWNNNFYNTSELTMDNTYWNASLYVGYCFGRKKIYRYDGNMRNQYVQAALSKSDMQEVRDVNPQSNLGKSVAVGSSTFGTTNTVEKETKYKLDKFYFNIGGCDLVAGPDGNYGTFTLEDGYITPGQDTKNNLKAGKVMPIQRDGSITFEVGHDMSYRTGNWWKSHLLRTQTTREYYPDLLHYAVKGKLVLYLRGRVFGHREPVKLEIPDFYISHGKDGYDFFYIGGKTLNRRSTYSLSGNVQIEGKPYRLYLEESYADNGMNLYLSHFKESNYCWMKNIPDNQIIGKMAIPGTHDAGTSTIPESQIYLTAHTQNFPIIDQTKDGIRCFDIRLKNDMKFGHTFICLEDFYQTMEEWDQFLKDNPSEFIIAMIGSDESGQWSKTMRDNFQQIINKYPHRFVQDFKPTTTLGEVRGKILVIKRQEKCPYGLHLQFIEKAKDQNGKKHNYTRKGYFDSGFFRVTDNYKQFKTAKKLENVMASLREAFEDNNDNRWYITFNSISWGPQHHTPQQYAMGAKRVRYPMNQSLYEELDQRDYTNFGILMLDFYNNHGEYSKLVDTIINANFQNLE